MHQPAIKSDWLKILGSTAKSGLKRKEESVKISELSEAISRIP